jgi:hypothetical protein
VVYYVGPILKIGFATYIGDAIVSPIWGTKKNKEWYTPMAREDKRKITISK